MMNTVYSKYTRGALTVKYIKDDSGNVGLSILPCGMHGDKYDGREIEPLVQLHVRGDMLPGGYANGATMCGSQSSASMKFSRQYEDKDSIVTELTDGGGRFARHTLIFRRRAVEIKTEFVNNTCEPLTLEMISSASFGMLSPYTEGEQPRALRIMTARSHWSSEGRITSDTAESLDLEVSWQRTGVRVHKIGQTGSMPVRGYFPFIAVTDTEHNVTWASSVSASASWQIEARRRDTGLSVSGGLADYDYGHWAKTVMPGETFSAPPMYVTAVSGDLDDACDALLDASRQKKPDNTGALPVMFNEFCTTWGNPSHENIKSIIKALSGRGFEYFVIDCGWFRDSKNGWWDTVGDWNADTDKLFPGGFGETVSMIKNAGMVPGIWFEPETCGRASELWHHEEMLLHRDGHVIDTGSRRFLDMRLRQTREYLCEKVIAPLRDNGFGYVKIDYNDCTGIGCDGAESLGEGLRQNIESSLDFYGELRRECPGIIMENCSSGGHRLSPAFMERFDMASFSDAHECVYIPIIAANLHRLILPEQSQIWAVLHGSDSLRRIHYSMVNTFLGVMCLSGDIYTLGDDAWRVVEDDIAFYRRVRHIIKDGRSRIYRGGLADEYDAGSYRDPKGWQAVVRTCGDETLAVLHAFGGEHSGAIKLSVNADDIDSVAAIDGEAEVTLSDGMLSVLMPEDFTAVAVYLKKRG